MGSWGKLGPSGCSVPLPAPEVWLGDSRPTCSCEPYTSIRPVTISSTRIKMDVKNGVRNIWIWQTQVQKIPTRNGNKNKEWEGSASSARPKKTKNKNKKTWKWDEGFYFQPLARIRWSQIPPFLLSILRSSIFSQVSCLSLLYFLWLWVSLIGDVEWWSWRPCVQVWANYRDSHQGWAAFWLQAQGIQSSWGSTQVKPVPLTSLCNEHTWEIQQASCLFDRYKKRQKHRLCWNILT